MVAAAKVPSGITIWNAMRDELLMNMYQLPFTTLPPTIFHVYLHAGDYERIEGIVPRIVTELQKALSEEVRKINQGRGRSGGVLSRLIEQDEAPPIEVKDGLRPRGSFHVQDVEASVVAAPTPGMVAAARRRRRHTDARRCHHQCERGAECKCPSHDKRSFDPAGEVEGGTRIGGERAHARRVTVRPYAPAALTSTRVSGATSISLRMRSSRPCSR